MSLGRKLLASALVIGLAVVIAGGVTWSSFARTTANPSNSFTAGTVAISDNDGGTTLTIPPFSPGMSVSGCINVTYTGSLASAVHMYATTTGTLAQYLNLTVTRGTQTSPTFPSCTGFTADATNYVGAGAGVMYSGTLSNLSTSHSNFTNGLVDAPGSPQTWNSGSSHVYMLTLALPAGAPSAAEGLASGATFTWEAQNQ